MAAGLALTALTYVLMRGNLEFHSVFHVTTPDDGPAPVLPAVPELPDVGDRVRAETLSEFLTQAPIALAVVTLLSAGLSGLLAGRVLRPIRQISTTAQRLSAENLADRVPVTAPADDLARLAETINDMLDFSSTASPSATACWTASACSPATPRTSCGRPWPRSAPRSTSRSMASGPGTSYWP